MSYNTITVTTSATEIVPANCQRRNLILVNTDASAVMYIGPDASITTSNAIPLYGKQTMSQDRIPEGYQGPIYGIVASGTVDARFWETTSS